MSETDRTQFMTDNEALFKAGGADLLRAFESGNYNVIEAALRTNSALSTQLERDLADVRQKIKIEEARIGEDRNETLIQ